MRSDHRDCHEIHRAVSQGVEQSRKVPRRAGRRYPPERGGTGVAQASNRVLEQRGIPFLVAEAPTIELIQMDKDGEQAPALLQHGGRQPQGERLIGQGSACFDSLLNIVHPLYTDEPVEKFPGGTSSTKWNQYPRHIFAT